VNVVGEEWKGRERNNGSGGSSGRAKSQWNSTFKCSNGKRNPLKMKAIWKAKAIKSNEVQCS